MKKIVHVFLLSCLICIGCAREIHKDVDFHNKFVILTDIVPDAILEIRYYGTYNFVGDRIDGYDHPIALLTNEAAKALEVARAEKVIGHSLNAKITIHADKQNLEFLKQNEELLQEVCIVSQVEIIPDATFKIEVSLADGEKCERCWMYSISVGEDKENPTICHKCSEALK